MERTSGTNVPMSYYTPGLDSRAVCAHIHSSALLIVYIWKLKQALTGLKTLFRMSNRDLLYFLGNARPSGAAYIPSVL